MININNIIHFEKKKLNKTQNNYNREIKNVHNIIIIKN